VLAGLVVVQSAGSRFGIMMGRVEFASFTFELYEHVRMGKERAWLDSLAAVGCTKEFLDERTIGIHCPDSHACARVGWLLFQTAVRNYGRVVAITGEASMQAEAYKNLPTKFKTRKL
jgi:hypothetical protein